MRLLLDSGLKETLEAAAACALCMAAGTAAALKYLEEVLR